MEKTFQGLDSNQKFAFRVNFGSQYRPHGAMPVDGRGRRSGCCEAYLLSPMEVDRGLPRPWNSATKPADGLSQGPSAGVGHSPEDRTLTEGCFARHNLTHPIELKASGPGDNG